ncbi:hypothetical protein [Saccharopolyspora sp. 6V]|uniref:hypothetical protein n=1 Tax=Saccharopolyspora sp. 6V TaxID=2877239 RepID=UPI001CD74F81|nr:hypothetical protein [Saccharopolyspora sp. 6V]MCA1195125.1 hypothetical protein [Saccharopolyspora sp. 6V]
MTTPPPPPPGSRWDDDGMAPRQVGALTTYPTTPAGPATAAPVVLAGRVLGWIWTDHDQCAGWRPAEPSTEVPAALISRMHGAAVARLAEFYARGVPAADVLDPDRWAPYTLGEPGPVPPR